MKHAWLASFLTLALTATASAEITEHDPQLIAELMQQNPFEIVDCLHSYSYDELREMYPDLDDRLMQALMYRLVESMKVPG